MKGTMTIIQPTGETSKQDYTDEIPIEDLNKAVGGYIELVPYFTQYKGEDCVAFCNEYGKINRLPVNYHATTIWYFILPSHGIKEPYNDYLVGPIAIITGDEEFMSSL